MSQPNKLSLWQKIKRLLTASAPQPVTDAASKKNRMASANTSTQAADSISPVDGSHSGNDQLPTPDATLKTDEKNTAPPHHNETPIVDCLKQYFNDKQWHYTHYRPKTGDSQQSHHLSLRMRHKKIDCGYLFRVQEKNKLLAIYGILPFLIPESHQSAALLLITQINYDMLIGNLEMDVNDGEIRYKNAIDVEAVGIDTEIIEHSLQSVVAMTTVASELFGDLINNQNPAEDMQTLLTELRQQSDARTFFLPTQFVQ
ncbi:MAG: YbjN domain-containing protein [Psychrobacter sp.]